MFNGQGPMGGEELLQSLGEAFHIPRRSRQNPAGKLIYLVDPRTREVCLLSSFLPCPWLATWLPIILGRLIVIASG